MHISDKFISQINERCKQNFKGLTLLSERVGRLLWGLRAQKLFVWKYTLLIVNESSLHHTSS